jgi:uridine phosphorylase
MRLLNWLDRRVWDDSDMEQIPLLEFDPNRLALIEPKASQSIRGAPSAAVACYFPEVIERYSIGGRQIMMLPSREPLWEIEFNGERLSVFYPGQGASLAAVCLERAIAAGVNAVVGCGGAGALLPDLALGHVVVVDSAVRDEGTSYHYLPASREVKALPEVVAALRVAAEMAEIPFQVGKAWTTDGLFRETHAKIERRRAEGCLVVDAEISALLAVGEFRGIKVGQYLYAGDDVSGQTWAHRGWLDATDVRDGLFRLAATAAHSLATK